MEVGKVYQQLCLLVLLTIFGQQLTNEPTLLRFQEFFEPNLSELRPSTKLLSLNGKRIRLIGYMAQMEKPPKGAFYLCPHRVYCDESGGGTADLPVEHVRVIMRSHQGKVVPFIDRIVEVTGTLEINNREEEDGTVSAIRLLLDSTSGQRAPSKRKH